jgi:hypothetical protein
MMPLEGVRCISKLYLNREPREEAKSLLPPSGGCTQVRTTALSLVFRAVIKAGGDVEMVVAL